MNFILTKKQIKAVKSLDTAKGRKSERLFKAEGTKCVRDTLDHFKLNALYATQEWIDAHPDQSSVATPVKRAELVEMTSLVHAPDVMAIYELPEQEEIARDEPGLMLALDTIQDPGNMGTIIRVADWFGVRRIIASRETVDCYSPKVIQATMGSISRVKVIYGDLPAMIAESGARNVYGTFLDGTPIGNAHLSAEGIIVIGNEGKGISKEVAQTVTHRLLIPSYPPGSETGESLNAAIAAAITLAKFRGI